MLNFDLIIELSILIDIREKVFFFFFFYLNVFCIIGSIDDRSR